MADEVRIGHLRGFLVHGKRHHRGDFSGQRGFSSIDDVLAGSVPGLRAELAGRDVTTPEDSVIEDVDSVGLVFGRTLDRANGNVVLVIELQRFDITVNDYRVRDTSIAEGF